MRCRWYGLPRPDATEASQSYHSSGMQQPRSSLIERVERSSAQLSACAAGKESVPRLRCLPVAMRIEPSSRYGCCRQDSHHIPLDHLYRCSDHHLDKYRPGFGPPRHKSHDWRAATVVCREPDHQQAGKKMQLLVSFQQVAFDYELCNTDHMRCILLHPLGIVSTMAFW